MKALIAIFSVLICTTAFAASKNSFDLKMQLSINGKNVSSPRLQVMEGETASVFQKTDTQHFFMEVVTTESDAANKDLILMKFIVGEITADGRRNILSRPEILTRENSEASITQANNDGSRKIEIQVTPKRIEVQ